MDLRIVIVDDIEAERSRLTANLEAFAKRTPGVRVCVSCYVSAEDFLKVFKRGVADIAFLDVCMDGMNGIQLATRLRSLDSNLLIVFVTTSKEFALDAYSSHPFDYLLKPYDSSQITKIMTDALLVLEREEPTITVRVPRDQKTIPLRSIVSAESRGHKTLLLLEDGSKVESTMPFSEIEGLVGDDPRFLVVNRGVLVNLDFAARPEGDVLVMESGASYPLRKRDRARLASKISNYLLVRMGRGRRG